MAYSTDMYPVQFDVEYPESRNRLTVLVRIILAIPILVIMGFLVRVAIVSPFTYLPSPAPAEVEVEDVDESVGYSETIDREFASLFRERVWETSNQVALIYFGLSAAIAMMILFRKKYPRWWFDWNLELTRFGARISAYILLLRDEYPSTDDEQAVSLDIAYPDAGQLNRVLPLIKWILAIPHYLILALLGMLVFFVTIVAWFAVLIIGRYPTGLFNFTVGYMRWWHRVLGYATLMITDRYPPFRFGP